MTGFTATESRAVLTVETVERISDIPASHWQTFAGNDNPLVSHAFLDAMETSGAATASTGWQPCHLKFYLDGEWVGVAPAYLKNHSLGEYVFDWAWADAWQRHGLPYYPKLLIAIPFTPCQGPRLMLSEAARGMLRPEQIHGALDALMDRLQVHSWHLLFPDARDQELLTLPDSLHRSGCQFHWFNRGYGCFDDFLAELTSRKRKSIRRERRQVAEQDIRFETWAGHHLPDEVLDDFYLFYTATYLKRGMRPYLNRAFFRLIAERLGDRVRIITAVRDGRRIAAALFILGEDTLFGRYWGCLDEYDHLHFEACYYQAIELAISEGLLRFDAGAQGEHKLVRGFEPVLTHSWHNIRQPVRQPVQQAGGYSGLRDAVMDFCEEEHRDVRDYRDAAREALPFRQTDSS